jgi:hypothetical protein
MRYLLAFVLVALFANPVDAYFPPNCRPGHAALDYTDSDAVVIARVIKIERRILELGERKMKFIEYVATLKVARAIRGVLKEDEEFTASEGGYLQSDDSKLSVGWIGQCGTHPRAGFQPDGLYVLFLMQKRDDAKKIYWEPRSCHYSVHAIGITVDEKTNERSTVVRQSLGHSSKTEDPVLLEEFLASKKKEARKRGEEIIGRR